MKQRIIYGLKECDSNDIRYIGQSSCGMDRPREHFKPSSLNSRSHKVNWVKKCLKDNRKPHIIVIYELNDDEDIDQLEEYFIDQYRTLGHNLTNSTNGGKGTKGHILREDTKTLISQKLKDYYRNLTSPWEAPNKHNHIEINGIMCKYCSKCDNNIELTLFNKDIGSWDGLMRICRECNKQYLKEYKILNPSILLTEEELKQSYKDRASANSAAQLNAYKNNPNLRLQKLKPIIATHIITGEIIEFPSATDAKKSNFHNTKISDAIRTQKPYKKYTWKFK